MLSRYSFLFTHLEYQLYFQSALCWTSDYEDLPVSAWSYSQLCCLALKLKIRSEKELKLILKKEIQVWLASSAASVVSSVSSV